ncbi:MAG: sugar phosphate isomerase/epimerase [Victivallales bacterium]|nr:sugar phosphate isomerase/epimerase [Victivallales bacterium]
MKQCINLGFVMIRRNSKEKRSFEEALDLCRNAGFMLLDCLSPIDEDDYLEVAQRRRAAIDARGMKVVHSHFPYFRYNGPGVREKILKAAPRAVKAAHILGAQYMVLHGNEYVCQTFDTQECFRESTEYLRPVIDLCAEYGIRPLIENMGESVLSTNRQHFGARAEEVLAHIDAFSYANAACCLDTGHLRVAYSDDEAYLHAVEQLAPYTACTHIHDSAFGHDLHKPAFFGTVPWEEVMRILKTNGYSGVLSWEFVYERIPDAIYPQYLAFIKASGEYLIDIFQSQDTP